MDRKDYIEEAQRQLRANLVTEHGEVNYYEKVEKDAIDKQYKDIKKVLEEGVEKNYFNKQFAKQMLPEKPKQGSFYLLPKVHKPYQKIPKGLQN